MTLIKSISGIRGTIGGKKNEALTPIDILNFTAGYAQWVKESQKKTKYKIVIGRDARISGKMVSGLVANTLLAMGIDVVDLGLSTTPTVEMAVVMEQAQGGIILTASHNPKQWNALKLLNDKGEFVSKIEGEKIVNYASKQNFEFETINKLGQYNTDDSYIQKHIEAILKLPLVDVEAIQKKQFIVAFDGINSTGGMAISPLLKALGVKKIVPIHEEPTGQFAHNPEPLPENLRDLSQAVAKHKAHVGFALDPDVDRLAIISEDGEMFGEEYTLVAVADYVLQHKKGNTVSNLSSTRALKDISKKHGVDYFASAVGEVNVVEEMKKQNAIIGGEGNGGIIYPELHYGRDALVGIALFLTSLAKYGKSCSMLRATFPNYAISKNKIELHDDIDVDMILAGIKEKYKNKKINNIDGVKIEFESEWVHLRKSNTEPIIRIYSESETLTTADHLANKIIEDIKQIVAQERDKID